MRIRPLPILASVLLLIALVVGLILWPPFGPEPVKPGEAPVIALIRVPTAALAPVAETKIDDHRPVSETIVGTHVSGTANVEGATSLKLLPSPKQGEAELEILLSGTSVSNTAGQAGPAGRDVVEIKSHTVLEFEATKLVTLDATGFHPRPAEVEVQIRASRTEPQAMAGGVRGKIVDRVAQRRIAATKSEADQQTVENTRRRVARSFDEAADAQLQKMNDRPVFHELISAATKSDTDAIRLSFDSDAGQLLIYVLVGDGRPGPGPKLTAPAPDAAEVYVNYSRAARHLPTVIETLDRLRSAGGGDASSGAESNAEVADVSVHPTTGWAVVKLDRLPLKKP